MDLSSELVTQMDTNWSSELVAQIDEIGAVNWLLQTGEHESSELVPRAFPAVN